MCQAKNVKKIHSFPDIKTKTKPIKANNTNHHSVAIKSWGYKNEKQPAETHFFFVRLKTKRQKLPITKIEQDSVKKSEAN